MLSQRCSPDVVAPELLRYPQTVSAATLTGRSTQMSLARASISEPPASVWQYEDGKVAIKQSDGLSFLMTTKNLITALERDRSHLRKASAVNGAFKKLITMVDKWINIHASKLHSTHLTRNGGGLEFVAVTKAYEYDEDLNRALCELELQAAQDKAVSNLLIGAIAIPYINDESAEGFRSKDWSIGKMMANKAT